VLPVPSAAITALVPLVWYTGAYPSSTLTDATAAPFNVTVRAHFFSPQGTTGLFKVSGEWGATASIPITLPAGESNATLTLVASGIKLWWPSGYGAQSLYSVSATFTPNAHPTAVLETSRTIGFRYAAIVTINDTDPTAVANAVNGDGTGMNGMFFRVNGAAIWSRGANMIPMDEFEGRYSALAHERVVQSAVDGGMNTLRVWGGGIFQPPAFYDACDKLGVIIYHDMQYAQDGHSPLDGSVSQAAEFRHQIRRLAAHPSIVIIDGCNECHVILGTPTGVYATFVLTIVASEDSSRSIWPSCPSAGWKSGVHTLDAHPNGSPLGFNPNARPPSAIARAELLSTSTPQLLHNAKTITTSTSSSMETHGPYQHGGGMPAVNGDPGVKLFASLIPLPITSTVSNVVQGVGYPSVFASEFGASVFSSFESMAPTLAPAHWGVHGGSPPDACGSGFERVCNGTNVMAQRNYPCDNIIIVYFGALSNFDAVGEAAFKQQLWQCMIGQSLLMKGVIEIRRSLNQFGHLIWQLK
jgi:beta-mannosidase